MADLVPVSFRLDAETLRLLDALARRYGSTRVAALRFIVRQVAEQAGLSLPPLTPADLEHRPGRKPRDAAASPPP
jgi:hypothetical protein